MMNSRWRIQVYIGLFITLLSIYLLVPTYFNFRATRNAAEKQGTDLPWYVKLFPDKQINLGLDLQGGIYLELEVGLPEALQHRSEIMAGEIERLLKEKNIAYQRVWVIEKTNQIGVTLTDPAKIDTAQNQIEDTYRNSIRRFENPPTTETAPQGPTLYWGLSDSYQSRLKEETMKQAVETIRNRIDRYGVAEPEIRRVGDNRVVVELPGVQDPDRAIALVKRAGKLEFKLVEESMTDPQVQAMVEKVRQDQKIPAGYTEEIVNTINEALKSTLPIDTEIAFEVQYDPITKKIVGGVPYLLKKKVDVSGEMLRNTQVSVHNNEPYVSLSFDPTGTKAFADLTSNNVGKRLAILLDGTVNKAPVIKGPIPGGEAQITLGYGDYQSIIREAEDLVVVLREGALPAKLKEATKTVIGPSLGKSAIDKGFNATLLAAAVVILFMAFYYKWSGVLADLAVILNVLFIFGALTLFGATLTLPGVAGIVLTIGMAVDANVIILERIKEEIASGKGIKASVDAGYSNAMRAIIDANLTTFLSGVILYQFGTGPVRGFAVTLMIGILTTLYTAVTLTRLVYEYILTRHKVTKLSL